MNLLTAIAIMITVLVASPVRAQTTSPDTAQHGAELYEGRCATCHDQPTGRTPARSALTQARSPEYIYRALTAGAMRTQAAGLNNEDIKAIAFYLVGRMPGDTADFDLNTNRCAHPAPPLNLNGSSWNGWGGEGVVNARYQRSPGLRAAQLPRLKLKWAFAYPGGVAVPPTVVGRRLFVPSLAGIMFALDAQTGCTYWAIDLGAPVRTAPLVARLPSGKFAVYVGDGRGQVRALEADTGAQIWRTQVDDHPTVRLTGAPTFYNGRLYVPVSSAEESAAADAKYVCCTFRGSLVALDGATGRLIWKTFTIDQAAAPIPGDVRRAGPSGAAIWSSPTVDAKRRLVYAGTGNAYSEPNVKETNAVIAFDLDTGAKRWVRQVVQGDVWIAGCDRNPHANCMKGAPGPDFDFASPPLLVTVRGGKDVLIATSKSGMAYGLDPDAKGASLWESRVGRGGILGGVEWGAATDGNRVYVAVSDTASPFPIPPATSGPPMTPGLTAIDPRSGREIWRSRPPKPVCGWTGASCSDGQPGAVLAMPGAVFAGSWDGHVRAYSGTNGNILWDFDTGRSFDAVNGAKATGGSIDQGSQTLAGGMLYVSSGSRLGRPGNALLAFAVTR